ncbi:MAG TPA: prepilin-type N-terminal cleavage/methylation domain-containing protein [Stellaceae bacterium]|nr:prepilin-type N-terminal cleavage/methylation domain-containing protein [Stellaceae bacterium]
MAPSRESAYCRKVEPSNVQSDRATAPTGFTLLELLVVLAIIAVLVAITTPIFGHVYARVRFAMEREDLERQLLVLPAQVRSDGHSAVLMTPGAATTSLPPVGPTPEAWQLLHLQLPRGWSMEVPKPIIYHFNGTCEGGEVVITMPSLSVTYELMAPLCRPQIAHAAAS